ncbi:MAG: ECF-type sigma factor [Thiohalomonadales bacterium]
MYSTLQIRQQNRTSRKSTSHLLLRWRDGHPGAVHELIESTYDNLCLISQDLLRGDNKFLKLQTQSLIDGASVRLVEMKDLDWVNRADFFSVWTGILRRALIDRARAEQTQDKGNNEDMLSLKECAHSLKSGWHSSDEDIDIIELSSALEKLSKINAAQCQIVELRYFAGLSIDEIALALDISPTKLNQRWRIVQTWLFRELQPKS